jgi:hypothetical protein
VTRIISQILTFIGGLYFFLEFILPKEIKYQGSSFEFGAYLDEVSVGLTLISSMAIGLGIINILLVHGLKITRSKKNNAPSIVLIASLIFTLVFLFLSWKQEDQIQESWKTTQSINVYLNLNKEKPKAEILEKVKINLKILTNNENVPEGIEKVEYKKTLNDFIEKIEKLSPDVVDFEGISVLLIEEIQNGISNLKKIGTLNANKQREDGVIWKIDHLIFYGLFFPLGSSMFSLLGFYITYAAFRSFKIKSLESTIMMISALIIILGQIPQGVIYISSDLPQVRFWIMGNISTPAFRAIYFCSAIAGLSLAVRMWFSMDKNPFLSK